MKQVYPQVRPRRLGTRGNSRYCYAGLKKRLKLEDPVTPECGMGAGTQAPSTTGNNGKLIKVNNVDYDTELNDAASVLIREWAGKLLNAKFPSLKELTLYLIDKMFVDNRSSAAHTILTSMSNLGGNYLIYILLHLFLSSDFRFRHEAQTRWHSLEWRQSATNDVRSQAQNRCKWNFPG